jgi:site-specific recombinase XerD
MLESKGFVTAEMLKNALFRIGTHQNTVMQEFFDFLEEKRKGIGIKNAANSYRLYCLGYRHLQNFLKVKFNKEDIPFGKVDIALIEDYAYYLKVDLQLAALSVKTLIKPFRTTIKRAFNKGYLQQDPFWGFTHEKEIIKCRYLSAEEIERIMKTVFMRSSTNFIRNMFLFSCFTGLSYADLKGLRHSNIQINENGSRSIVLNRKKTGTASYIPLLDISVRIIEKYSNTRFAGSDGKVFKTGTLANLNMQLKSIAQAAGIEKTLTFHISRHSFATSVCLTNGIPIETLSQMMGHLSIKTTQIYAQVTRTKLNEDMTNLAKRIEGKYKLPNSKLQTAIN